MAERDAGRLQVTVLGSGTSVGVPTIGCSCRVCMSSDPRDKRLRPSVLLRHNGHAVVIDTGPDFRQQALRSHLDRLDAVLFTHAHADHILGIDDLRPYNFHQKRVIPIYAAEPTFEVIRRVFAYVFFSGETESSRPRVETHVFNTEPFEVHGLNVQPVPLLHGKASVHGFRIGRFAYLTDHSEIPEESLARLRDLDVLFLDALRYKPHPTHSTIDRSLKYVEQLAPRRTYFTHISHDLLHQRAEELLPPNVRLAYDGLEIEVEVA
ncbi:MAG: MBL fold metallo-hydrolase [Bryobacterales bacterium]|nr:MBL fold metallo-hydrolase [Bryobacterales bacterium]